MTGGEHSQYLPDVLEGTQCTVRSPLLGLDSTVRSVGGDKAAGTERQMMIQCIDASCVVCTELSAPAMFLSVKLK